VDYYWKSEKSEHRVIEDGETEEMRLCEAAEPWSLGHIARGVLQFSIFERIYNL
jgi:hypothetical protein